MALDDRFMPSPSPAPEVRFMMASSASTPSLRSRDVDVTTMPALSRMDRGGNVKVVVRLRAFLERGTTILHLHAMIIPKTVATR
jgi:hypothetical protein